MSPEHANSRVDECRRRVRSYALGHQGREDEVLYPCRRLLTKTLEPLDDYDNDKLNGLIEAGDPHCEVRMTWYAKDTVGGLFDIGDSGLTGE